MHTTIWIASAGVFLLVAAVLAVRRFLSPMVVIRPSVTGPVSRYLGRAVNQASAIYAENANYARSSLVLPFAPVVIDRLEMMAVIHFREQEGIRYLGLEPQVFQLPDGTTLKKVLATTEKRDEADIYVPHGELQREKDMYRVALPVGKLRDTLEAEFSRFDMSIDDTGLLVDLEYVDRYQRTTSIHIDEQKLGKRARYKGMVAPASLAAHEQYFPLLFLGNMSIARRRTETGVRIDGAGKRLVRIPVLGTDMIIYGKDTVGFYLFLATEKQKLEAHEVRGGETTLRASLPNYEERNREHFDPADTVLAAFQIRSNEGFSEIAEAAYSYAGHRMRLQFGPRLPSLLHMKEGTQVNGRFAVSVDDTEGVISGTYQLRRGCREARVSMQLEDVYQPVRGDKWVRAYRWESVVRLDDGAPLMDARWHKRPIVNDGLKVTIPPC